MLTLQAPAKLNLTLEVLGKRPDGYHEIRSVIQTISLCDELSFELSEQTKFTSDSPAWIGTQSLIPKATSLLQQITGCTKAVTINVTKRIPLMSGLGGDSSDAAATLRGLNQLWDSKLSREQLAKLAWQLGSDVAFFLHGGTVLVEGRGEIVTPLPPFPHVWVVLAMPPMPQLPGKTAKLYASLKPGHFTDGGITVRLVAELKAGKQFDPSLLFNVFENVAFGLFPEIGISRQHMVKLGAADIHLSGSGPTLFTLVKERNKAEDLYRQLQYQRLTPFLAETLAQIDKV